MGIPGALVIDHRRGRSLRSLFITAAVQRALAPYLRSLSGSTLGPEVFTSLARLDRHAARIGPPRGTHVERVLVGGLGAEWIHGRDVPPLRTRVILYLHGGGWVCCGLNTHRRLVAGISRAAGVPALALNYRMVPVVSFGEMVGDCVRGYRWLLGLGVRPDQIVIMGDSAGAHLTFAAALRARREGLPLPAALVGISGAYELNPTGKAAHANAAADPVLMAVVQILFESVLDGADPADPAISPARAELSGLPPVLLVVSSSEILYRDSEDLARLLTSAGVACTLQVWDRQLHVFQALGPLIPESRRSVNDIGRFAREALTRR